MSLYHAINLRYTDPICSMFINDKFLVLGSVLGRVTFCELATKTTKIWTDLSSENITGIVAEAPINSSDLFYIAIGDDEIQKCKVSNISNQLIIDFVTKFSNYDSQREHSDMCSTCFTIISPSSLLMTYFVEPNLEALIFEKVKTTVKVTNYYSIIN